jgi:predicted GTPase
MHLASRALACGADFGLIGPDRSSLSSSRLVISVCAVRTGCGKDSVVRRIAGLLKAVQMRPVVVRHPMPYGDLSAQAVQRFATSKTATVRIAQSKSARNTNSTLKTVSSFMPGSITLGCLQKQSKKRM